MLAFETATQALDLKRKIKALLAYTVGSKPRLAAFNENEDGKIHWNTESAHIGSISDGFIELTEKCISGIRSTPDVPPRRLVQTLALVQSYGIHRYLLEEGVGGCFSGLYVDQQGIHWQPDTLYLVTNPDLDQAGLVGSFARRNVLCLFSSLCEAGKIVFASPELNESGELLRQRYTAIERQVEQKHEEANFDYVTVFNTAKHVAVTVELLGHHAHELLIVEPHPETPRTTGIFWSPQLLAHLDTISEPADYDGVPHDLCLKFFPYRPPPTTPSPEELENLRRETLQSKKT